jgi:hypothetical protein
MGWFDKKKKPSGGGGRQPEPPRTPGRTSTHKHAYTIVISDITTVGRGKGGAGRAVTRACTCGQTQTTSS